MPYVRPLSHLRLPSARLTIHEGYSWASRKGGNAICLQTWDSDEHMCERGLKVRLHNVCAQHSQNAGFWAASYIGKEILDRFGHNYTRSAARLQLQKLPQVHLRIMIAEAAISTLQHVCISRHEDKHS